MAVSVAIWSQDLEANKRNLYTVENDVRITGASLGAELVDPAERTIVEVVVRIPDDYELSDEEDPSERPPMHKFVLCALTAGKVEQQPLDIVIPEGEEVEFVVKGKNPVHLYGNYIQQSPEEDDSEDGSEDEFDLDEMPSELGLEDDDDEELGDSSRFEEIQDTPASVKTGKRAREDEEMADVSTATGAETSATMSKKEKKRAKKLKNEAGKAAPAPTATATATATTEKATTPTANKEKKDKPAEKKDEKKETTKPVEKKEGGKKDGEKKKKSEPKTLAGGVVIEDKTIGSGPAAKAGKKIGMRYIGRLKNGKVFDSNTKGKPFFFTLGKGDVIKGWDEGIPGMLVGGERVLTIPAAKAYGKRGAPPDIPPNSDLIFEVKLVEVK